MNIESTVQAHVATSFIPKLNSNLCLPIYDKCGGIEGFFRESTEVFNAICRTFNILPEQINRTQALENAKRELEEIHRHHINICTIEDQSYPILLKQCEDIPLTLYYTNLQRRQTSGNRRHTPCFYKIPRLSEYRIDRFATHGPSSYHCQRSSLRNRCSSP